ncbi:MAG TPA: glucan biosynthesis protein, partial [Salinarimonas sp.]|nr:glucan biosynthesis protein [Salinarimonas sp.]
MRTRPPADRPFLQRATPSRRELLALAGGAALASGTAGAQPAPGLQGVVASVMGDGQRFDHGRVVEIARALARRPFAPVPPDLPEAFANLNYEQYVGIRALPGAVIWGGEGRGFVVEPLQRGFVFTAPVMLFTVEDGTVRRIAYDRSKFDYGRLNVPPSIPDIGFSGVRLHAAGANGALWEFAILQGATFVRALGRGQNYGAVARALTLRPAEARGEEIPAFRAFWLERPLPGVNALVVHGLIDSESVAGAVRMTFRPGDATIVDVETTLFPRANLEHVGLGGMTATYLHGGMRRRNVDDVRPAVYDASGLQMVTGAGEHVWRPVQNPETLQISAFLDRNPQGFGLVQRDRDYAVFQDDDQRWDRRSSLWVEPVGEWGPGQVQLIEIPTDSEVNDNILAYWRPRAPMAAGSEVMLAFRQFWGPSSPVRPPVAIATNSRVGRGGGGRRRRFSVDFTGEAVMAVP